MSRPRVLVVVDAPGWAHDHKARALVRHLSDEFEVVHRYHAELRPAELDACDLALFFYWMQLAGARPLVEAMVRNRGKLLVGICSEVELDGERGADGLATLEAWARAVFVHSERLRRRWAGRFAQPLYLTPNGVDLARFTPPATPRPAGAPLRVGWAGSLANFGRELRGFDLIHAACAGLDGVVFDPAIKEERQRDHAEMAAWYRGLDVYVCASSSEGTPNPCLEAAASGVPLVTTPVGNMPELVVDGRNGFFVTRDAGAIAARLALLRDAPALRDRLAAGIREDIRPWGWDRRAEAYRAMLRAETARCEGRFSPGGPPADPWGGAPACTSPPARTPSPPPFRTR
ncbi:MAG: glycosyltransferase family 4 protein [Planctomycetota bacterium]